MTVLVLKNENEHGLVDFEAWLGESKLILFILRVILNWLESYLLSILLESVILLFQIDENCSFFTDTIAN